MGIPKLAELGLCHDCEIWLEIDNNTDSLPTHKIKGSNKKCPDSGMSPWDYKYLIKTKEEARAVADFIENDSEVCLDSTMCGSRVHTLNCGDGRNCSNQRLLIAKALAKYCSKNLPQ